MSGSTAAAEDVTLVSFLRDSVSMWGVNATVDASSAPVVAQVQAQEGAIAWVERADRRTPFRWAVRWRAAGERPGGARERRPRLCASLVGVLNALQSAVGVSPGSAVRVAPVARPARQAFRADQRGSAGRAISGAQPGDTGRIPVTVLTGFLGSGKTTLLSRLLRHPEMGRTAVVINEFGDIGLDHDLVEASDETFVTLSNGCLCCKVRSDFVRTLGDLAVRRARGALSRFDRVVVETSGLADPAPLLHALMIDDSVRENYVLDGVITTVDAATGLASLERYPESLRQAAIAELIVLTKTDIARLETAALMSRLRAVNPRAPIRPVVRGDIAPSELFQPPHGASSSEVGDLRVFDRPEILASPAHEHTSGLTTFAVLREQPLHAATLPLFLSLLAENCGSDLLRMKGIVAVAEEPQRPAVIHGVQHVYYAPEWLDRWPSDDRRTRLVFIGRNVTERWVRGALDLLETEVDDTLRARSARVP